MKKSFFLILAVLISLGGFSATPNQSSGEKTRTLEIIIHKGHSPTRPRSVTINPILCTYHSGVINLNFTENIGMVTVVVTNQSTGEQWLDVVDSITGQTEIIISDDEGDYVIEMETDSEIYYSGYFSL